MASVVLNWEDVCDAGLGPETLWAMIPGPFPQLLGGCVTSGHWPKWDLGLCLLALEAILKRNKK